AEREAEHPRRADPQPRAEHVRGEEASRVHAAGAREDRHDRAYHRNEAREHHGARAASLEELLRPLEVLSLEDVRVRLEQARSEAMADPVPDLRAENREHERADQ